MNHMLAKLLPILCLAIFLGTGCGESHPSDYRLVDNFHKHKTEFERLREMFQADSGLGRVGNGFTRPDDVRTVGLDGKRIAEYHRIFDTLDLPDGIEGYDDKRIIWFHASSRGLIIGGSSKGYVYSADPSEWGDVVNSLDGYRDPKHRRSFTAFRHIEDNWYLYFEVNG